ncbi:MAG TPA: extracellular solute-binding protein, partial [Brumimicrobium sp.]|nr:extracellular solute-binding protein [Brumimicrobium sp.]
MKKILMSIVTLSVLASCGSGEKSEAELQTANKEQFVTVYTHRHYESDQDIFRMFEEKTGIQVKVVNASADELIQKMKMEEQHSPADVLITVDAGRLSRAKDEGLLQSIESEILEN